MATVPAPARAATSAPKPVTPASEPVETPHAGLDSDPGTQCRDPGVTSQRPLEPEGTEAPLRATSEPETLPPGDVITPLDLSDSEAALSRLSKPEISCLEQGSACAPLWLKIN